MFYSLIGFLSIVIVGMGIIRVTGKTTPEVSEPKAPDPPPSFSQQSIPAVSNHAQELSEIPEPVSCPCLSQISCRGIDIMGEFLYWKPSEGGTEYAVKYNATNITSAPPIEFPNAIASFMNFEYEPGWRIGLSYHINYWDLKAVFTHLNARVSNVTNGTLFPSYALQVSTISPIPVVTQATAHWNLHYSVADFQIVREESFGKSFLWMPYFGVKGARIQQRFYFGYSGGTVIPAGDVYSVVTQNTFEGIGLQGGVGGECVLGAGFRLFANAAAALVWGCFDVQQKQRQQQVDQVLLKSTFFEISPTTTLKVGLAWWTPRITKKNIYFGLSGGFEQQYWWHQNQMPQFIDSSLPIYQRVSADLSLQGWTASAYLNF